MTLLGLIAFVAGALVVVAGIENWSLTGLLQGKIEKR